MTADAVRRDAREALACCLHLDAVRGLESCGVEARLGMAFVALPPSMEAMTEPGTLPETGAETNVAPYRPFSPQQTGNSASGVKRKPGSG